MNRALGAGLRKTMNLTKKAMLGIAIAIAAVAAAVIKLRNNAKTYILQIDKMTKVTGMSTQEFTKLAYAADQEHASLETLSKSLPILSKYMAYAQQGMETYKREFDKMGITVTDAKGRLKSAYQVLLEMSDFMGRKGMNDTEKMAIMMTLLGRRGAELIPMLKKGSAWFKKMGKEAESLGIVLDKKTTAAIKRSDDSLTMLKKAFLGVGIAIIKAVEPSIERIQNALITYVKNAKTYIDEHREDINKKLIDIWGKVKHAMEIAWNLMKKMMDAKWRAEQFGKVKEAFQKMVPYVKGIAYGMGIIAAATNAWLLALLEIKGILEIGSKLYNFIALKQSEILLGQAKEARALAESYKAQVAEAKTIEEKNRLMKEYYKWMKESTQMSEQAARNADKVIKKGAPTFSITDMFKGGSPFPGLAEAKEKLDKILEPMKTASKFISEQADKEGSVNALLEKRKEILAALQKARARIPKESFRSTAESGEKLVVTEKGKTVSAEQFDRTVAEAKAQNQALDSLKTATEGMLGDLIQNYKDGKIGIDELAKGIANYSSQASSLSSAQTNAISQVISIVKNLISKTNSLAKTVNNQSRRIKQLAGQGA